MLPNKFKLAACVAFFDDDGSMCFSGSIGGYMSSGKLVKDSNRVIFSYVVISINKSQLEQ